MKSLPKVTQDSSNLYSEVPGRKKGHRPTVPITEDSGEFPQPLFIQSLLLPYPTPFCCCCASDGTSHTLSRALPVARPFCSPSWMHRPIWGELRLKDPCCPSRGSRALGKQNDFIPQLPSPRRTGTLAKCADTTNCGFWASKDLRASRPNPPLSRGWKCPKEGKQSKAEDPYLPRFFCR